MRVVDSSTEVIGYCPDSLDETMIAIEEAARACYRSEHMITPTSFRPFVHKLFNKEHTAMIEHSWKAIRMCTNKKSFSITQYVPESMMLNPFIHIEEDIENGFIYLVGNYRAWVQYINSCITEPSIADSVPEEKLSGFDLFCKLDYHIHNILQVKNYNNNSVYWETVKNKELPMHLRAITCRFVTSRCVTHELVRHRPFMGFAQESQRYVGYLTANGIEFIRPSWYDSSDCSIEKKQIWYGSCKKAEIAYQRLIDQGCKRQEARTVLPNSTKTSIVVTAPVFQWNNVDKLRTAIDAYPPMRLLMTRSKSQRDAYLNRYNHWDS